MGRLTRKHLTSAILIAWAALSGPLFAQESIDLTRDEARIVGRQAVSLGDSTLALGIADSLLQADPNDGDAWLIRAAALLQLGQPQAARQAAGRAYSLAQSPAFKYEAARIAALSAANEERFTVAGWWLRLALIAAPTEADEQQTRQDAALVSGRNPWRTTVRASLLPSGNVNGGTDDATYSINGEDVDFLGLEFARTAPLLGRALSGWRGTFDISTQYILDRSDSTQTALIGTLSTQQVWLSNEARTFLEDNQEDGDAPVPPDYFNYTYIDLGAEQMRVTEAGLLRYSLAGTSLWQSGRHSQIGIAGNMALTLALDDHQSLTVSATASRNWFADDGDLASDKLGANLRYRQTIADVGRFGVSFGYATLLSPTSSSEYDRWSLSADFSPTEPIGPAYLTGVIGISHTDFPTYIDVFNVTPDQADVVAVPGGRQDDRGYLRVIAAFPTFDYAGFFPVVTLESSRTMSNVGRFDRRGSTVEMSFQSSF